MAELLIKLLTNSLFLTAFATVVYCLCMIMTALWCCKYIKKNVFATVLAVLLAPLALIVIGVKTHADWYHECDMAKRRLCWAEGDIEREREHKELAYEENRKLRQMLNKIQEDYDIPAQYFKYSR